VLPLPTEDQLSVSKTLETGVSALRTEEQDQEVTPGITPPSLKDAVERLKMEREQRNLYTGLVIGLVTGVGILSLLVRRGWARRWSGNGVFPANEGKLLTPNWRPDLQKGPYFHLVFNQFLYCMSKSWKNQVMIFWVHDQ
jgi:hypothetical protein